MAKILIVDDEKEVAEGLAIILQAGGFQTSIVNGGKACLDFVKKARPDMIVLDINMPEMDGGDVAIALSEDPMAKNIPIVFVSAMVTKGDETKVHGHELISKLSTGDEILKKIKHTLQVAR